MAEPISRRTLLIGSVGVVASAAAGAVAFSHSRLPSGVPQSSAGLRTINGSFVSQRRHGVRTAWRVATPSGTASPRVLITLHGRGDDHTNAFDQLYLDYFLAQLIADKRTAPFAIASIDGGEHDYWHPRRSGDTAGMVIDEFVPLLAAQGIDTSRVGLLGWSMGGYGALYIAGQLGSRRCAVAVAESPAVWHTASQSAPGAFDDAADFDAHSIFGHLDALNGIALRVDCGASDGFAPVTRDLRAALSPEPAGGIEPGAHDATYWRSQASAQLQFVGAHLTV